MKTIEEVKEYVGKLVAEKGLSYNSISIRLGRNPSYLQKFVKEKYPKRLDEVFRRELALILDVPEEELTDRPANMYNSSLRIKNADNIRIKIKSLLEERCISMASASIAIGKNSAYLQQYIVKGSPIRLPEEQRKRLSVILDVPEQELTDISVASHSLLSIVDKIDKPTNSISELLSKINNNNEIIFIKMLDINNCCKNGEKSIADITFGHWAMPLVDFRQITMSAPENIKLIRVKGDSMNPTLKDGDWIMVDITHKAPDSDGLFLLHLANGLAVKRVQCGLGQNITVISDNPIYAPIPATLEEVPIAGKIIYTLKAEKVG